jgi:hypothetical protein
MLLINGIGRPKLGPVRHPRKYFLKTEVKFKSSEPRVLGDDRVTVAAQTSRAMIRCRNFNCDRR